MDKNSHFWCVCVRYWMSYRLIHPYPNTHRSEFKPTSLLNTWHTAPFKDTLCISVSVLSLLLANRWKPIDVRACVLHLSCALIYRVCRCVLVRVGGDNKVEPKTNIPHISLFSPRASVFQPRRKSQVFRNQFLTVRQKNYAANFCLLRRKYISITIF